MACCNCIASLSVGTHVLFFQLPKWRLGGVGVCYFSVVFFAPEKHWHELVTSMSVIFQGQQMISSWSQGKVEFSWLLVKIQAWTKMFVSYTPCSTYVCCVNGKSTDLGFSAISAPARKINPSFIGAISCHRREFHTSGECTIRALSHPRVGRLPLHCMRYSAAFHYG